MSAKDAVPGVSTRGKASLNVTSSPTTLVGKTKTTNTTTTTNTTSVHNTPKMSTTNNTNIQTPKINKLHLGSNNTNSINQKTNSDAPYDFTKFGLIAEDIDLSENDLYTVCSQIQKITYLRQAYKIMEEQMMIIYQLLPMITPAVDKKIEDIQDIKNWITLQKTIWENSGYTKITTTQIESENAMTKKTIHTFDIKQTLDKISQTKIMQNPEGTRTDNDTEEEEETDNFNTVRHKKNRKDRQDRKTVEVQPPKIHPTLQKLDDIRSQFSRNKLIEDCGETQIDGKSEYHYFADVRKKVTWLVDSWENSLLSPYNKKTQERFEQNVDTIEDIVKEATSVVQKRLIGKAYRKVKGNFRHLFFPTEKLDKQTQNYQNHPPNFQQRNYQQQNQRQPTYYQQNQNQNQQQRQTNYQTYAQRTANNIQNAQPHHQQQSINTSNNTPGNDNNTKNLIAGLLKTLLEGM